MHIDRFTAGLDDLTRRQQGSEDDVLDVLRITRRFSAFEATANQTIAKTMTRLQQSERITTEDVGYPWTKVTHIDGEPI